MSTQPGLFDQSEWQPDTRIATVPPGTRTDACIACGETLAKGDKREQYCSPSCRVWASKKRRQPPPQEPTEAQKKAAGQAKAAEAHAYELGVCRRIAREIAQATGTADIERVRERLEEMGLPLQWGAWTGTVFAGFGCDEWEPTGQFVEVRHRGGRRRGGGVRVWKIRQ